MLGDAVLLPEPTGLDLLLGGAGVLWCDITVTGRAGHAHEADAGANPILACLALAAGLRTLEDELNRGRAAGEARCVVNVGTIEGGDWRSSAPVGARLGVRVGFPPDWPADAAESAVRGGGRRRDGGAFVAARPERDRQLRWLPRGRLRARSGTRARADDLATRTSRCTARGPPRTARRRPRTRAITSTSSRCPALCYGPRVRDIHGVDEAVELASIVAGARTLTRSSLLHDQRLHESPGGDERVCDRPL